MKRLDTKTAVIFGATGGIGGAIARGFVQEGATVIPVSRNEESVRAAVSELNALGNRFTEIICCDVTRQDQVEQVCARTAELFGRIDIMACVSGAYIKKPATDISLDEWNTVLNTNLTGTFITNQAAGKYMLKQGKGSIINIGSLGSDVALSNTLPYCASKAGVVMVTKCLSSEWAGSGVRVNTIIPGVFPTNLNRKALSDPVRVENIIKRTPIKRLGAVDELAGAAIFLASDESAFVTGIALPVDGGFLAFSGF
ncbi:MAG: SDR family oxidoreductase [Candidatus Auribacter fodinae]|jgi:NAD(P)-dependent dehydrogenase (short-subunit alcohol dehydrogenase family)|uniref:SDR family oxidoreductase n=1 Tax=Candidatus Auribacter fodinae TaxID=2093366 RepID=A0A3A4R1J8_9BACT|nr:MAG: SDR family oxidoreductase [Candidatus Auribacter fodinae]